MSFLRIGLALALVSFGAARAEDVCGQAPTAKPAVQSSDTSGLKPVSEDDLSKFSGGQESVAITDQRLTAVNGGNSVNANSVVNGPISISANAFSGFAGVGNFVMNTGNNNNLQGTMSVNIIMAPAN